MLCPKNSHSLGFVGVDRCCVGQVTVPVEDRELHVICKDTVSIEY